MLRDAAGVTDTRGMARADEAHGDRVALAAPAGPPPPPASATSPPDAGPPSSAGSAPPARPPDAALPPPDAGPPAPSGPGRRWLPVRTRILAAVLALAALGMVGAGATAIVLQRRHIDARIDDSLDRAHQTFVTLADEGVDPATGLPFTDADDLVRIAMRRAVPGPDEGMLGFLGSEVHWLAADSVPLRLEDDAQLVAALRPWVIGTEVVFRTVTTEVTEYRALVVPVTDGVVDAALVRAIDRTAEQAQFTAIARTYALVALGSLVVVGVVGWLVAGRLLRPVRELGATARRITDTPRGERLEVRGNDDVTELTVAFNDMLDRLDASFEAQRRLLDDVGHELRTPLTVIRGHLEVMDAADPEDAAATRTRALAELDRMRRLTDDLVTLATAGSPSFVQPEPADLGRLVDDALDHARHLGERAWTIDARPEDHAVVDRHRLLQAALQLAANAVKFSGRGSTVTLGAATLGSPGAGRVRLWVRDQGVGIEADQLDAVFERFGRAPGARRTDGAGLGLAIVAAIAEAHGGEVTVASTPGVGSVFTLDLPWVGVGPTTGRTP